MVAQEAGMGREAGRLHGENETYDNQGTPLDSGGVTHGRDRDAATADRT